MARQESSAALAVRVEKIMRRLAEHNPDPKPELVFHNPFQLLVAVVLSAQAQDKVVNKVTERLFAKVKTPKDLLELGATNLLTLIKQIGLSNTKAKNLIAAARILVEQHQGQIPSSREALEKLPGVGRKSSGVITNLAFDALAIPVDTHVGRIAQRLALTDQDKPDEIERDLLALVPKVYQLKAHHWLILHGRYVCKSLKPLCAECFLQDLCPSRAVFYPELAR